MLMRSGWCGAHLACLGVDGRVHIVLRHSTLIFVSVYPGCDLLLPIPKYLIALVDRHHRVDIKFQSQFQPLFNSSRYPVPHLRPPVSDIPISAQAITQVCIVH